MTQTESIPLLSIQSVSKRFRSGVFGVKDFSLDLSAGVIGLLGPNGAGKTTLMQMIATVTSPTSGTIHFQGGNIVQNPDPLRTRLGYLPQDFGVYENVTAMEFLQYFAALKGVWSREKIQEMLELVNLHTVGNRMIGGFSGGMKQRLGIAQALINDPDILIVDEPTAGLDPEERVRFRGILSEIGFGKLVLLSTHIVSDIESVATEIAVMRQGSLVAFGPPEGMLRRASGSVWKSVVSSEELETLRTRFRISTAIRKTDGVHVRIVSRGKPLPSSEAVEPDLEDAFLFLMDQDGNG